MLKKMMLLAGMALAAMAFVGPASAFADTHWVHNLGGGVDETVDTVEEEFTGIASFELKAAPANKFECEVHVTIHGTQDTVPTEATGEVTNFEVTTNTCNGGGVFTGCKLSNDTSTTPWDLHVDTETLDMTITEIEIVNTYENCLSGLPGSVVKFPKVTATPDNPTSIDCITLSGEGTSGANVILATGELCAYHAGTIGVEKVTTP